MSLTAFLSAIVGALEDAGIPHMLTGSLAAAYYASPRATQDVDLVVEPDAASLDRLVASLTALGFYVSADAAQAALETEGQFHAIDPDQGWKADLIIRKSRPFSANEFERRQPATVLGVEVSLTRIEDLILAKLEWMRMGDSELQRRDVLQLVSSQEIDLAYVEEWAQALSVVDEWNELRGAWEDEERDASE